MVDTLSEFNRDIDDFFTIYPRGKKYGGYGLSPIPLEIVHEGVETKPDINITVQELNNGAFTVLNNTNTKTKRLSFTVKVIIHKDYTIGGNVNRFKGKDSHWIMNNMSLKELDAYFKEHSTGYVKTSMTLHKSIKVIEMLDYWIRNGTHLMVVSKLIDVPDAYYIITDNKKRTQDYWDYTIWELTFTKKVIAKWSKYKNNNAGVKQALKAWEKSKKKNKEKADTVADLTTSRKNLAKCDNTKIVYSKEKKTSKCAKYMQQVLYHKKFLKKDQIDGWYGKVTKNAVKEYQTKYKEAYNLPKPTGNLNKPTFNLMIGKLKKVSNPPGVKEHDGISG